MGYCWKFGRGQDGIQRHHLTAIRVPQDCSCVDCERDGQQGSIILCTNAMVDRASRSSADNKSDKEGDSLGGFSIQQPSKCHLKRKTSITPVYLVNSCDCKVAQVLDAATPSLPVSSAVLCGLSDCSTTLALQVSQLHLADCLTKRGMLQSRKGTPKCSRQRTELQYVCGLF